MHPPHPLLPALLAACLLGATAHARLHTPAAAVPVREVLTLDDGTRIQVESFPGASKWALLHHFFTAATVDVRCKGHKDFAVFSGQTLDDVRAAYGRGDRAWCGWDRFLGRSPDACTVPINPFGPAFVAVAKPKGWFISGGGGGDGSATGCEMTKRLELSTPRLLSAIVGSFLFAAAPQLAASTPFRLAGGTAGFVALSAAIALVFIYRSLPHRRSIVLSTALFGSTVAAAMRLLFGTWLPSAAQLIHNPFIIGYVTLSALTGLALTYYYNDTSNRKINTMLRVALQLAGLGLLAASASSLEGAVAAVAAAIVGRLVPLVAQERDVLRALRRAKSAVQHDFQETMPEAAAAPPPRLVTAEPVSAAAAAMAAPGTPLAATPAALAAAAAAGARAAVAAAAATPPSPLTERGLILNVETGKTIKIGKVTYNRLVEKGYDVDLIAGTITPPREAGGNGGSGGDSGSKGRARRRRSSG